MRTGGGAAPVLGREEELGAIQRFLEAGSDVTTFVLAGDAGVGKTTLWEAAVDAARERDRRILAARASGAETRLSFVSLSDMLESVEPETIDALPAPQRRALDVALLADEPEGDPPEERAVAVALLAILREVAKDEPVLVAVDDVQWLDAASARALSFAARRLRASDGVLFLFSERMGVEEPADLAALPGATRLEVGPLNRRAIRRLLEERLDLSVPRRVMDDLMTTSGGNPLFALEVGRTLKERGLPAIGERIPVPAAVEELLGARVQALPGAVRALVLAAALSPLRRADLARLAPAGVIDAAVDSGALVVERDRVRLAHPLLGAAALARTSAADQRAMHALLAGATTDEVPRALHLAQACEATNPGLAETVARAAALAAARGAAQDAAELSEHALRLTPRRFPTRPDRVLELADHLFRAGQDRRLTELLDVELADLPPGAPRVRAHLLLNEGGLGLSVEAYDARMRLALVEAGGDPVLEAPILADQAMTMAVACVERIEEAERLAEQALAAAPRAGPEVERIVVRALAWARSLRGKPIDDLAAEYADAAHTARYVARAVAVRHAWRGEIARSRRLIVDLLRRADEAGDAWSSIAMRLHVAELEVRAGRWEKVAALLDEWDEHGEDVVLAAPLIERCRALLAAGRGDPAEAEHWVARALEGTDTSGVVWDRLEVWRARGVAALAERDPARAAEWLGRVWEHTEREGVEDPGVFPAAPDLGEALVELERLDEARALADRLERIAVRQDHPWGLLGARRVRALAAQAEGAEQDEELRAVAAAYDELGLRFDAPRTLLALGRAERRRRRWAVARDALTAAAAAFESQGATGWAALARGELERVGGRKPRTDPGELTPAERRVVELAASGQSNKEIAQTLVVSINTVEGHLTRAYAKLGVRSRAELASRVTGVTVEP